MSASLRFKLSSLLDRLLPHDAPGWILLTLVIIGAVLRIAAEVAWWPTTTTLSDSWTYAAYAGANPFDNPQHPGGYSVLLAVVGLITREVAVAVALQHVMGIASALLFFAAVKRITGSPWPALVPAAAVLLSADQIFLEHSIMSEGPFVFLLALSLYSAVRAFEEPQPWWGWPLATGVLIGVGATVRTAGLFLIPVYAIAFLLWRERPWRPWLPGVGALVGAASAVLVVFAIANHASTGRFEVAPSVGWHLYQRVAPFADCSKFTPPEGAEALCESQPAEERPGGDFYLFDPASPAVREFGPIGSDDDLVGAWAREAALAQPGDLFDAAWNDFTAFFVPSAKLAIPSSGEALDPQLDWEYSVAFPTPEQAAAERATEAGMETFYNDFTVDKSPSLLGELHDYQRVFRFGAVELSLSAFVALLGLFVGPRRNRVGTFLCGVGGIALLLAPVLGAIYVGRYTVPLTGPLTAAAAIAAFSIWRLEAERRDEARSGAATAI